jgi:hypothetical protein
LSKSAWGKLSLICWLVWFVCLICSWAFSCPAIVYVVGSLGWMIGLVALIVFFCKKKEIIIEAKPKEKAEKK